MEEEPWPPTLSAHSTSMNKEKFDQVYFPAILKQVEQYGGKLLAASEKQQVVEGNWLRGRTVQLWEFPDVETV